MKFVLVPFAMASHKELHSTRIPGTYGSSKMTSRTEEAKGPIFLEQKIPVIA